MKRNLFTILALVFAIFFTTSCEKDPVTNPGDEIPTLSVSNKATMVNLPAAMQTSSDTYAQQVVDYVSALNTLSNFMGAFMVPDNATRVSKKSTAGTITYSWDMQNGYTMIYAFTETSDKNIWVLKISDGISEYDYLYAEESKDGKNGVLRVYGGYMLTGNDLVYDYTWNYDDNGTLTFVMNFASGTDSLRYEVVVNTDGSGSISYQINGSAFYEMTWDATGNGTWSYYDVTDGSLVASGSWTV